MSIEVWCTFLFGFKGFHICYRCKNLASNHMTTNLTIIIPLQPFLVSLVSVSYSSGKKSLSAMCICVHLYELLLPSRHWGTFFIKRSCVLVASGWILEEYAVFSRTLKNFSSAFIAIMKWVHLFNQAFRISTGALSDRLSSHVEIEPNSNSLQITWPTGMPCNVGLSKK